MRSPASRVCAGLVRGKEAFDGLRRAVENHVDVGVAGGPDIVEETAAFLFGEGNEGVAQLVESLAQGRAPELIPARLAAVAAAVGAPALDAVGAAPGGVVGDLALVLRRELLEEAAVIGELDGLVLLQQAQRVGQRHLAVLVMVAVGLAVGGDVDQAAAARRL